MQILAMHAPRSRPASQRYFMWLLCLAFLLPVAQLASAWHVLSHTNLETRVDASVDTRFDTNKAADGQRALPHPTHCDLCLTASAVGGGALPSTSQGLAQSVVRQPAPQTIWADVRVALLAHAYRSRAPPVALL